MPKLVVKKHRPLEIVLAVLLFSGTCSVIIWFLLDANHWNSIKNRLINSQEARLLWEVNKSLEADNLALREKVIMLERSTQIDNQTAIKLQDDIRFLQEQVYRLKGELEFYQGIMSSTTDSKGLNIQGLHIEPTDKEGIHHFKLVLTNVAKSDKVIEVTMDMSIQGTGKSGDQVLLLKEVISGSEPKREVKFKNFERIEGNLSFPDGFKPLRVIVELKQKGLNSVVHKEFDWPARTG